MPGSQNGKGAQSDPNYVTRLLARSECLPGAQNLYLRHCLLTLSRQLSVTVSVRGWVCCSRGVEVELTTFECSAVESSGRRPTAAHTDTIARRRHVLLASSHLCLHVLYVLANTPPYAGLTCRFLCCILSSYDVTTEQLNYGRVLNPKCVTAATNTLWVKGAFSRENAFCQLTYRVELGLNTDALCKTQN